MEKREKYKLRATSILASIEVEEDINFSVINLNNVGKNGELLAANYLVAQGYEILEANYFNERGYRVGEIDIVAKSPKGEIIFVEVKARKGESDFWVPGQNINSSKLSKIEKAANKFLQKNKLVGKDWRIDLIGILFNTGKRKASIRHIKAIRQ